MSIEKLSSSTANAAVRMLKGESGMALGATTQLLDPPVFDSRELRRWNIPESRLPDKSTIIFRERSWEQHKQSILAFAAVFGAEALVMIGLVTTLTRRRRTEQTLRESEGRFRTMSNALSGLSRRLMQTREQEQARVTKELQDDLCQRMMGLTMQLHSVSKSPASSVFEMRNRVGDLSSQFTRLTSEIFALSDKLYGSNVTVLGLVPATRIFCEQLAVQHGVTIDVHDDGVPETLSKDVSLALFRVMQEAVRNAVKYSAARDVRVSLRAVPGEVQLEVTDEGAGFDPDAALKSGGLGLIGMKERLSLVDGQCAIDSEPGTGTRVTARAPVRAAA
jgi:signal transduction histidine kinase